MRVAVVGHVEWVRFATVERLPEPGEIMTASATWEEPAGGGAVAAGQLRNLAGEVDFFVAVGNDELGQRTPARLEQLGFRVHAATRDQPQRRAFTFVDAAGERTITVLGEKLHPLGADPLPWDELAKIDAVYFTRGRRGRAPCRAPGTRPRGDGAGAADAGRGAGPARCTSPERA